MVELEEFKYGGTNISAYRLVDPELEDVQNVIQDWVLGELRYGRKIPFQGKTIKVLQKYFFYLQFKYFLRRQTKLIFCSEQFCFKLLIQKIKLN